MAEERSPSGAPIHRHERVVEGTGSVGDGALIDAITEHIERHLGPVDDVWHQVESPWVHVDVHVVEPTEERPWRMLVTSGMSERPMRILDEDEAGREYAELVMALPRDFHLDPADEDRYWPIRLLTNLAALPHQFDTHLWESHTVPNLESAQPYAPSTELCGALIAPAVGVPAEFRTLRAGEREISFFGVVALHADEMDFKLEHGVAALYELLDRHDVSELLDPGRRSVVRRRRFRFGRR